MNVLITGGAGFIGMNTAALMRQAGHFFVAGIGRNGKTNKMDEIYCKWKEGDVGINELREMNCIFDIIIHCAGSGSVRRSYENPNKSYLDTINSTLFVLEYIRQYNNNAKIIFISSSAVYGSKDSIISINDSLSPISVYGTHKKLSEDLIRQYHNLFGLNSCIVRFFSVYGDGLRKQLLWDAFHKFKNRKSYFTGSGDESRDWLHIDDAISLIHLLSVLNWQGYVLLNGGSGKDISNRKVLELLKEKLNSQSEINFIPSEDRQNPFRYCADISETIKLGWKPKVGLEDGISRYSEWLKKANYYTDNSQ